jgi:hypothetical protein
MVPTTKKGQRLHVDPELLRQLDERATGAGSVGAVLTLRPARAAQKTGPNDTEAIVRRLLQRVKEQVGMAADDYHVFRNLGSFVVVAPPQFVRALIAQDEIASATANRQPQSFAIPPRGKRPVGD